jgi:hypothetical protein
MILLLGFLVLTIVFGLLAIYEVGVCDRTGWVACTVICAIVFLVMGGFAIGNKYSTRSFKIEYAQHVAYIDSLQSRKINTSERMSEIEAINGLNQKIANCKLNKGDAWVGIWTMGIRELDPIGYSRIPQAVDDKDLNINQAK